VIAFGDSFISGESQNRIDYFLDCFAVVALTSLISSDPNE
jgi:hypothetical protein